MIVELCGAPAAGKSTQARLLAAALLQRGHKVSVISSFRPSEIDDDVGPVTAGVRRFSRPVRETLIAGCTLMRERDDNVVAELLHVLPPRNLFWHVRMRQYLLRLLLSWKRAQRPGHIILFDQAFVQALASLVDVSTAAPATHIERAFHSIPKPDLLIRVHAPDELLRVRLERRQQRQSWLERLLEFDIDRNLRFVSTLDNLCAIFANHVAPVVSLRSGEPGSREAALTCIELALAGTCPNIGHRPPMPAAGPHAAAA
jgi:hypothetical protein